MYNDHGIILGGGFLCLGEAVLVFLGVPEAEFVYGLYVLADFTARLRVEKLIQPFPRGNAHVMIALGTDFQVPAQFGAIQHSVATGTLGPDAFGDRAPAATVGLDARREKFFKPAHK